MKENLTVKEAFDRIAVNGFLGDPIGEPAYSLIRVSSAPQAEDGRSGLPRQLEHCHEVAGAHHLKIPWNMIYADDGFSGFEFEDRPALSQLREEIKQTPRSRFLIIEHIDRLSRNARWHQGFLLDEFEKHHITVLFWKGFHSEIERAVLGTIAEEGMRTELSRMMEGTLRKAKDGRVTAKRPRFGYRFVDSQGQVSDKVRQDTHYALHPEESQIVRKMYHGIIYEQKSLRTIAIEMNDAKIPTRVRGKMWCSATVWRYIADPIYKGEFYAHRFYGVKTGRLNEKGRPCQAMRERPREEWIKVEVPQIVSSSEWKLAQDIMAANQTRSPRNMKRRNWLLSSFCKCAHCGYGYIAIIGGTPKTRIRYYGCNARNTERARLSGAPCRPPYVHADKLEEFVWSKIEELIMKPELFVQLFEEMEASKKGNGDEEQLAYLRAQLQDNTDRYERWRLAYEKAVITLEEYQAYRAEFQKRKSELEESAKELEAKVGDRLSREEQKRLILEGLTQLRTKFPEGPLEELPFATKRFLLGQLLNCIWIDSVAKTIRFEGVLKATYEEKETGFVFGSNLIWQ